MALKDPADAALKKRGSNLDVSQKAVGAFRTISEVSRELDVPQHVLRFWETKFSQIRPMKRAGGRRYYRPEDVCILLGIREFLYDDGYTIRGVQKLIRGQGGRVLTDRAGGKVFPTKPGESLVAGGPPMTGSQGSLLDDAKKSALIELIEELEKIDLILEKYLTN
ncbi:MAG: MerR family transcriptional regulator [Rhodospirillaceae bacterium]|nr:MerR family transcriptional regulator [Rhodospirillaceae bacterium]